MTIEETLAERGARYGDFTDHAMVAQRLQDIMRNPNYGWAALSEDKRQALTVIADKIARILTGDPEYRDNWHDIQGYAKLAEDRCKDQPEPTLYEKVVDRVRPADPLVNLRFAIENAVEIANANIGDASFALRLALNTALHELNNQKKDD